MDPTILVALLLALAVAFFIFLLLRAVMLWYWKVDRIVSLLESIDKKLEARPDLPRSATPEAVLTQIPPTPLIPAI
jgi:hypothetical protein